MCDVTEVQGGLGGAEYVEDGVESCKKLGLSDYNSAGRDRAWLGRERGRVIIGEVMQLEEGTTTHYLYPALFAFFYCTKQEQ